MAENPNCDVKLSPLGDRLYSALEELPCALREQDILNCIEKIERIFRDDGWIRVSELTRKEFLGLPLEKRREILGREVKVLGPNPRAQRFAPNSCEAMGMD